MITRYELEGFDAVEAGIRRIQADAAYLTLADCTDYRRPEPCGRYDFEQPSEAPAPPEDEDDEDKAGGGGLFDDSDDGEGDEDRDEPSEPPDRAEGALDWVRETAKRHAVGSNTKKFRVKVYAPKANTLLWSGQFVARDNLAIDEAVHEAAAEIARGSQETIDREEGAAAASIFISLRELGGAYKRFADTVLATQAQQLALHRSLMESAAASHRRLEGMVVARDHNADKLLGALITTRFESAKTQSDEVAKARELEQRGEIAKKAIDEFSKLTSAYFMSQGVPQEFADIMGAAPELKGLLTNPEFKAVLTDADFRKLVSDPQNQKDLAGMIRRAVELNKAQTAASAEASTATDNATSNPTGA